MDAWAICDTDGGRHEPRPLLAHVYPLERIAEQRRERRFDDVKQYYPIRKVRIEIVEDEAPVLRPDAISMEAVAAIATPGRK